MTLVGFSRSNTANASMEDRRFIAETAVARVYATTTAFGESVETAKEKRAVSTIGSEPRNN